MTHIDRSGRANPSPGPPPLPRSRLPGGAGARSNSHGRSAPPIGSSLDVLRNQIFFGLI